MNSAINGEINDEDLIKEQITYLNQLEEVKQLLQKENEQLLTKVKRKVCDTNTMRDILNVLKKYNSI